MSKKKPLPTESSKAKPSTIGRYDVLDTDGNRTSGLASGNRLHLKGLGKYKIAIQPGLEPQLEQEKERAARVRHLLDSIHPGCTAPEGVNFAGINFTGKDLERVRFSDNNLRRCNLREGRLRDSHWKNCDLSGVDFRGGDLRGCILDSCHLEGADLRHADLTDARIIDCNLSAANFDNAILDRGIIDHCEMGAQSFHNASCAKTTIYSSQIIHGFFDNTDLTGATLSNVLFRNCTLTGTKFQSARLDDCVFRGCDSFQDGPVFSSSTLRHGVFMDCEFATPQMENTEFFHCLWERVAIDSALLEGTRFNEVNFQGGVISSCYALDRAPTFTRCRFEHTSINETDLTSATFTHSAFIGATIRDSDFSDWELLKTGLDDDTVVESAK